MATFTTVSQRFLPGLSQNIPVRQYSRRHAGMAASLLHDLEAAYVGVDVKRSPDGCIDRVAFATLDQVFLISVDAGKQSGLLTADMPFEDLLSGRTGMLVGFDMARLALQISHDLKIPVRGVDFSTLLVPDTRNPFRPSSVVKRTVSRNVDEFELNALWDSGSETSVCLRAWISACAIKTNLEALDSALKVDTFLISSEECACLRELVRQTYLLEDARPKETPNEFNHYKMTKDGTLALQNARYRTRVRRGQQMVIMTNEAGQEFFGRPGGARGKNTSITFTGKQLSGPLQKVRVIGRPEPTNSEKARDELLLLVLQGQDRNVANEITPESAAQSKFPSLNPSQAQVASAMISSISLVIAHGPPGTGKTTTIAAATAVWDFNRQPTWIIAHSNVAVKNIAETLFKKGVDFKILVSKEFHLEWHEHIYEMINDKLLRSDDFSGLKDAGATERLLGGSCIILSTLSMLSNPILNQVNMFKVVPVERLVVDEASQIKIEDFMPVFHHFNKTLEKVCFFGDPRQLPPFGQDKVPQLRTIFDIEFLSRSAGFLDVQYRMPVQLGNFISRYVYQGKLKSNHGLNDTSCVAFIDVSKGEETRSGFSWTNAAEIQTIIHLVETYYKHKNFCIITPYDAQRAAIEKQLKDARLPWEYVFNVDSFQGNEADFVLISVVRSGNQPGFLSSLDRMNVMLTRCRRGLVVVTNRSFLEGGGRYTLLGGLQRHWSEIGGHHTWVDWKLVAEGKADLPSAPGPKRDRRLPLGYPSLHLNGASVLGGPGATRKNFDTKSLFRRAAVPTITPALPLSPASSPSIKPPPPDTRLRHAPLDEWQTVRRSGRRGRVLRTLFTDQLPISTTPSIGHAPKPITQPSPSYSRFNHASSFPNPPQTHVSQKNVSTHRSSLTPRKPVFRRDDHHSPSYLHGQKFIPHHRDLPQAWSQTQGLPTRLSGPSTTRTSHYRPSKKPDALKSRVSSSGYSDPSLLATTASATQSDYEGFRTLRKTVSRAPAPASNPPSPLNRFAPLKAHTGQKAWHNPVL
ncbi:hypothetical protein Hypma_001245 [Hypsizygus marmoreus]|uniref:Helicase ATP-binding domain-containing protein n=1 Tax=Hypsizygus marmoreus TaxID=39966 RepID=A0A369JDM6_HYPMA|nr:hypothetical protein Hypma_001245 [Hypsizygus marmoreus]